MLAIDGTEPQELRKMWLSTWQTRQSAMIESQPYSSAGGFSPTIGIIGAVLGLIH
jgi:chemotaxis protein MotA